MEVSLDDFCKKIAPDKMERFVRGVLLEVSNALVTRSPVGDAKYWQSPPPPGYVGGRYRGSWQYSFGSPAVGETGRIDASGGPTLSEISSGIASSGYLGVHYLVNNVPYAERIENGWSGQAPQGVMALVEIEIPQIAREVAIEQRID